MEHGGLLTLETGETVLHAHLGWLIAVLEWAAAIIDIAAIALLLIGAARFIASCLVSELAHAASPRIARMARARIDLARYILAALELFIVSDIIHTVLSLKFSDLLFLGLLVVIRSITSFFLERELDGLKREAGDVAE